MAEHEPERLIAEAHRPRERWEAAVYVALARASRVATDLADRLERAEQERRAD